MSDTEAIALAATLRACAREGEDYEAVTRAGLKAADMLERQARQLAALRAGADTEDLHAAVEADARRQALEDAAEAVAHALGRLVDAGGVSTAGRYWVHAAGKDAAAAIRALADKPAAGGAEIERLDRAEERDALLRQARADKAMVDALSESAREILNQRPEYPRQERERPE